MAEVKVGVFDVAILVELVDSFSVAVIFVVFSVEIAVAAFSAKPTTFSTEMDASCAGSVRVKVPVLNLVKADEFTCVAVSDILSDMVEIKCDSSACFLSWNLREVVLANVRSVCDKWELLMGVV